MLLDTHTFLWFITNDPKLSQNARSYIEDSSNEIWLSIASIWEMAIKYSAGKLSFAQPFDPFILNQINVNNFAILHIAIEHTVVVATLPFHHKDPFDRVLIAQALVEGIPLLSIDKIVDAYSIKRLW